MARAIPPALAPSAEYANRTDVLTADIPSAGTMTARGAARMYAALLGHAGEAGLVSACRLAGMAAITYRGMDQVAGIPTQSAFGHSPYRPGAPPTEGCAFGMPGANGSAAYADISTGVAVAIMRNRFTIGDFTAAAKIGQLVSEAF
jgi:CubicO group peptidase (beta-lactamase class C family)